jgi:hypothetical protein
MTILFIIIIVRTSNLNHGPFYGGSSTAQVTNHQLKWEGICVNTEQIKDLRDNYD